jgi:hypothetical protein
MIRVSVEADDRDAGSRHIVRRLDQREAVALADGVPEALQLAACVLKDAADGLGAFSGSLMSSAQTAGS